MYFEFVSDLFDMSIDSSMALTHLLILADYNLEVLSWFYFGEGYLI